MKKCLVFIAAIFMLSSVYAAGNRSQVIEKPLVGQTLDSFNQESAKIREQMQPGGIYGLMKKLLQDHATQGDLPRAEKISLTNAQEEVNGILRHNDNNRLVCERRAPLGSNIPVTTCRTFGEMETARREAQKSMNEFSATHH